MKSKQVLWVVIMIAVFVIVGCGSPDNSADISEPSADQPESTGEASEIVVIDQMGREVIFTGTADRIISLSPSNTEILFALGLADRIVGVTEYCNYPPEAMEKVIVGGFSTPNLERIVELEADLVVASTIHVEEVPRLEELGIPVLVIESSTLLDLYASILIVAEVTGVTASGENLIASMQERIGAVEALVSQVEPDDKVKVYYEVYSDPLMSAGKGAFINEIITLAGGINIFGDVDENYPQISAEVVAERQPQIILYPDYHGTADLVVQAMTSRPGWDNVPAVLDNMVFAISDDSFARPGPKIVEAVEEAARIFYPQLFN